MKKIIALCLASLPVLLMGQATLPTSWNAEGTAPTGWTTSGTGSYSQGQTGAGIKMNGTNQYVQIFVADEPGAVSYYIKGQTFEGASFQGTFSIQESVNGSSWTNMRVLQNTDIDFNTFTQFTDNPNADSRYIRFYFTNKISGSNINLDEINIAQPAAGADAEINISFDGEPVINNTAINFGGDVNADTDITIAIENAGTSEALTIANYQITGTDASAFAVKTQVTSVAATSTENLVITFSPTVAGSHTATLTFDNNDDNENPGIIILNGFGDGLASEPAGSPSNVASNINKSYRIVGNFTPAVAEGHIALLLANETAAQTPADGTVYQVGDVINDARVIAVGDINTFTIKNVLAATDYTVAVFAYNGSGEFINYNANPGVATITSAATMMPAGEYSNIDRQNPTFISDLHNKVFPHQQIFYSNYDDTYINKFAARDTVDGKKVITCVYTSDLYMYTPPFTFDVFSREHSYPFSWMPHTSQEVPSYSDVHNLYPANQDQANAIRSNYPLGEVVNVSSTFKDGKYGTNDKGQTVYEPRDEHKGDAARAIFYMAIAYQGENNEDWSLPSFIGPFTPYGQDQNVLKAWHFNDLPDGKDIARNDFIDSLQGNRNPFVDMPELVCGIDFRDMSWITDEAPCTTTDISAASINDVVFTSRFTNNSLVVNMTGSSLEKVNISLFNINGQEVFNKTNMVVFNGNNSIPTNNLASGIYLVKINANQINSSNKVVK